MPARVFHVLQVEGSGDRGLAQVAGAQRALVHRRQLRELGISRGAYNHRIAAGSLHHVLPSVVSVVHPLLEPLSAPTAALLYAGDDTLLSHESAAALWGLTETPSFVAITVIDRHVRSPPGLAVHRTSGLDIRDARHHLGFPVTSPARTLIDCASNPNIDRLLNEARALNLATDAEIRAAMERCPGRKGTGPLRALLEAERDTGFTRSKAERALKRVVKEAELDPPVFNTRIMGVEVDAVWGAHRVVVEVDGYLPHGHYQAFQRDRAKANKLVAAGYVVLRFTWPQVRDRPMLVAATIARTLAKREPAAA